MTPAFNHEVYSRRRAQPNRKASRLRSAKALAGSGAADGSGFRRRASRHGKGVNAAGDFVSQKLIDHALTGDAALSLEQLGDDGQAKMRFAAGAVGIFLAGVKMSGVLRRLIDDVELSGRKRGAQFTIDVGGNGQDGKASDER